MAKKTIAIMLMIAGALMLFGVGLIVLDKATTSAQPEGLSTWIFRVFEMIVGVALGIRGWVEWNKKDPPS